MPETVLDIRDLTFSYDGEPILSDVSLSVEKGAFYVIFGPNGGGKTTLLKLILGLLEPRSGSLMVLGTSPRKAVRSIGYVPQNISFNHDFPVTVMDVALMGRIGGNRAFRGYNGRDRAAAEEQLRQLDVWDFRDRRVGSLSGGQLQRVLIARALATEPDILLLDEPTAGIDINGQLAIYRHLKEMTEQRTVITVSHDLSVLLGFATQSAHVHRTVHTHTATELAIDLEKSVKEHPVENFCTVELINRLLGTLKREENG